MKTKTKEHKHEWTNHGVQQTFSYAAQLGGSSTIPQDRFILVFCIGCLEARKIYF